MRDVYDIMDPAEIRQWELKKTIEWAMRTPTLQSISGYEGLDINVLLNDSVVGETRCLYVLRSVVFSNSS